MHQAYEKVKKVIESCNNTRHFKATKNMIIFFYKQYNDSILYDELAKIYYSKRNEFVWF